MNPEEFYSAHIKPEIQELCILINPLLSRAKNENENYSGWKVWYSDVFYNPDILFIGINPNDITEYSYTGKQSEQSFGFNIQLDPEEDFQYNSDEHFKLASDTRAAFEKAGVDMGRSIKTNYYYLGTNNVLTLGDLYKDIGEELNQQFRKKSAEWTKKIIEIIAPKIIICEGVSAFDSVIQHALKSEKEKFKYDQGNGGIKKIIYGNIPIIGYGRKYSNMLDSDDLVEELKELKKNGYLD